MPPKKKQPQPIDRPLSRAYLRQFRGWSTAYPPGMSDPTSLRLMENVLNNRDGSVRVRPGLRNLTFMDGDSSSPLPADMPIVGSFEPFYLNDGRKAYLFACRDLGDNFTFFRVGIVDPATPEKILVTSLVDSEVGFTITGYDPSTGPQFLPSCTYIKYLQIDNKILALPNNGEDFVIFHVGATKTIRRQESLAWPEESMADTSQAPQYAMLSYDAINSPTIPPSGTLGTQAGSLIDSDDTLNVYNYAFFVTLATEIGESFTTPITQFRAQRPWGGWSPKLPSPQPGNPNGAIPSATLTNDPTAMSDQLVVYLPGAVDTEFGQAVADGAVAMNVWMMSWSVQSPVPVEAQLIATKVLPPSATRASHGYVIIRPTDQYLGETMPFPAPSNRSNSSGPSGAGQGIVAADRLVLVNDPNDAAVIRWTTNAQGNYLDFASHVGGGKKTLTSGNMQIPACVKLWQNPQSVDTLTVLNLGTDGHSTAYYMSPASVTSQSDNTIIMGFEETTATPGTTSPYGCEVANNALFHPLDDQLMKSTASNYNINHKSQTDLVANKWVRLLNKEKIVSCYYDQRLYYLVHNPDGAELEDGCFGNELWVLDTMAEMASWSRWLVQGISMRKVLVDGRSYLALVKPAGIYVFDEDTAVDEYSTEMGGIESYPVQWYLETNTQGANRAHDAWALLKQANIQVGNFQGRMKYGIRGIDLNGRKLDRSKVMRSKQTPVGNERYDMEDYFTIDAGMKEWVFYAGSQVESVPDGPIIVHPSSGQINLVQYRYAPISVNVGYEYGTVESFEYGRGLTDPVYEAYDNGIPQPMIDTQVP